MSDAIHKFATALQRQVSFKYFCLFILKYMTDYDPPAIKTKMFYFPFISLSFSRFACTLSTRYGLVNKLTSSVSVFFFIFIFFHSLISIFCLCLNEIFSNLFYVSQSFSVLYIIFFLF